MKIRRAKYFFGDESFTSKDAVKKHAAAIRARFEDGAEIPPGTPEYRFVEGLLLNHVYAVQKVGSGIKALFVNFAPDHPTRCFWVRRISASEEDTDIGLPACLDGPYQLNRASLRDLVRPQINAFRQDRIRGRDTFVSEYSGQTFPAVESHVDHVPTFDALVEAFFRNRPEDPRAQILTISVDASSLPNFADPLLAAAFEQFHQMNAHLRLVHKRENLSDIKLEANRSLAALGRA